MKTYATQLRRVEKLEMDAIPNGPYKGTWGGYVVHFTANGIQYEAQTKDGIRTPGTACVVQVKDGTITVEVKSKGTP